MAIRERFIQSRHQTQSKFGLKAFKSVLDIPEDIDLTVVATPNKIVPAVMEEV